MMEKILWSVVAAIGGGAVWLFRSLFLARPRLVVRYEHRDGQSSAASAGTLKVRWGYRVTITNVSKNDALEICVVWSRSWIGASSWPRSTTFMAGLSHRN
jgi:hypothetical protein